MDLSTSGSASEASVSPSSRVRSSCDLEVEVNSQYTFFLRQRDLITYCGRIFKIFKRTTRKTGQVRILLQEFPGGAEAFELAARFCYTGGSITLTPYNISKLRCVAEFLEMNEHYCSNNLIQMTELYLKNITQWGWEDVLTVLRGCEEVLSLAEKTQIVQRCADALAWKVYLSLADLSPLSSSPDSSANRFMSSRRPSSVSQISSKMLSRTWWFADIASLSIYLMEKVVKSLMSNNVDNKVLAKFLLHYLRSSLPMLGYSWVCSKKKGNVDEEILHSYTEKVQKEVLEAVVGLLHGLERSSISCRFLFSMYRVAIVLSAGKTCKKQLEAMIGSQLDMATLDNILVPVHPPRGGSLYDVDLVIRLVGIFLKEQPEASKDAHEEIASLNSPAAVSESSITKVGDLIDKYLAEIAPDHNLKLHKFQKLTQALPVFARPTHDGLYRAIDIYLEAHPKITEAETVELCKGMSYQRLTFESCKHVAKNPRLPPKMALEVILLQQSKLRSTVGECFLKEGDGNLLSPKKSNLQFLKQSLPTEYENVIRQNQELKSDLHKMQNRVVELEKLCKTMKSNMAKHEKLVRRLVC